MSADRHPQDPTLDLLDAIADVAAERSDGERLHGDTAAGEHLSVRFSAAGGIVVRRGEGAQTLDFLYAPDAGWLTQDRLGVARTPADDELLRLAAAVRAAVWQR